MYKEIIRNSILGISVGVLFSCNPENNEIADTIPPGIVKNISVSNSSNGELTFKYDLPQDEDIYYVKLRYQINGKVIERKASYLNDSILVEGLPDTSERTYEFIAGDRVGNESTVAQIKAACQTPPHILAYNTSWTKGDYGGGKVGWNNESKLWVYLNVEYTDKENIPVLQVFKTNLTTDSVSVGNLWNGEKSFSYYFTDRFGNKSEKKQVKVNALPALLIPKQPMKLIFLQGDITSWYWELGNLFNGELGERFISTNGLINDFSIPQYFTIDLGREAQISKVIIYGNTKGAYYKDDLMKEFEIYGTAENLTLGQDPKTVKWELVTPKATWVRLYPNLSDADNMAKGFTVNSVFTGKIRFLRVKLISRYVMTGGANGNWYGRYHCGSEWSFLGNYEK